MSTCSPRPGWCRASQRPGGRSPRAARTSTTARSPTRGVRAGERTCVRQLGGPAAGQAQRRRQSRSAAELVAVRRVCLRAGNIRRAPVLCHVRAGCSGIRCGRAGMSGAAACVTDVRTPSLLSWRRRRPESAGCLAGRTKLGIAASTGGPGYRFDGSVDLRSVLDVRRTGRNGHRSRWPVPRRSARCPLVRTIGITAVCGGEWEAGRSEPCAFDAG